MSCIRANKTSFETLKKSTQFQRVFSKGQAWHNGYFVCFFMPTPQNNVGFVASKKVGNAVKRNRSKRRLRALFASVTGSLKLGTYIFVAKQPLIDAPFPKIDEAFITSLKRLKTLQR